MFGTLEVVLKDGGREGIRTPGLLIASTFPITPLYIHVEKDFQSHHMQIYSSTLMGGQEGKKMCEECLEKC